MTQTQLYRHFDKDNNLLYVGISVNPSTRLLSHKKRNWFPLISRIEIENYQDKKEAMKAEKLAIQKECPIYNYHFNPNRIIKPVKATSVDGKLKAKKLIDALGGCQAVADILNACGHEVHSRQRIFNWYKKDAIPAWAQLAYPKVWARGKRKAEA